MILKKLLLAGVNLVMSLMVCTSAYSAHVFTNGANLSGNHYSVSNTPSIAASGYQATSETGEIYSAVFTAPNTTNNSIGAAFYIERTPYNSNVWPDIYVRLQEYDGVSAWSTVASATFVLDQESDDIYEQPNIDDLGWCYVNWDTPYQYTTISAGYYRIAIQEDVAGPTGSYRISDDSGGTYFAALAVDDRTSTIAANDSLWVISDLTIDTSVTLGNAVTTYTTRTVSNPINILTGGNIIGVSGSRTLTLEGNFVVGTYGTFGNGTAVDSADDLTFTFDMTGVTSNNIGILFSFYSKKDFSGASRTDDTLYVSGDGSTGSPLTVPSDWAVNDRIFIQANDAKGEQEKKYIKTKPSGTTATLSDTVGGAESAFSNNHDTNNVMLNLSRNVTFNTNDSTKGFRMTDEATCYDFNEGARTLAWIEFEYPADAYVYHTQLDYCSFHDGLDLDYIINLRGRRAITHTGTSAAINSNISSWNLDDMLVVFHSGSVYQTLDGWFMFDSKEGILLINGVENAVLNSALGDGVDGALVLAGSGLVNFEFRTCTFDGGDGVVFYFDQNIVGLEILSCVSGGVLDNSTFIRHFSNTSNFPKYRDILIDNTLVSDTNYWSGGGEDNAKDISAGSKVKIQASQQTDNANLVYYSTGSTQNCGASLSDTTTRTAGNFSLRFSPEDSDVGIVYKTLVPVTAGDAIGLYGFFRENAAFFADTDASITIELFFPGEITPADDCDFEASAANTWELCDLVATYTGSIDGLAEVRVTVKADDAGAYCYLADVNNGANALTGFKINYQGEPSPVLTESFDSPVAVWNVLVSSAQESGTFGKLVKFIANLVTALQ